MDGLDTAVLQEVHTYGFDLLSGNHLVLQRGQYTNFPSDCVLRNVSMLCTIHGIRCNGVDGLFPLAASVNADWKSFLCFSRCSFVYRVWTGNGVSSCSIKVYIIDSTKVV